MRDLGVPRRHGWLGGVCAGIAARLGIDPLIVRGIFAVVALVGFPALIVYAIAWALLPDTDGRIHLQELGRGRFEPALVAILIMVVVGFLPIAPWVWSTLFWPFSSGFGGHDWGPSILLSPVMIAAFLAFGGLIVLVVWLVLRASKNSRGGSVPDPRTASADAAAPGSSSAGPAGHAFAPSAIDAYAGEVGDPYAQFRPGGAERANTTDAENGPDPIGAVAASAVAGGESGTAGVPAEPALDEGRPLGLASAGTTAAIAATGSSATSSAAGSSAAEGGVSSAGSSAPEGGVSRSSAAGPLESAAEPVEPPRVAADAPADELAQWRAKHEEWRGQHEAWRRQQADADAAAREQARGEREAASALFAAEAAERRRVRLATKPRASAVYVLAVIGAALVGGALMALAVGEPAIGAAAGLLVAAIVSAAGMVIAGAARRRSGFLAFTTVVLVCAGIITSVVGTTANVLWGDSAIHSFDTAEQTYLQPWGRTDIVLPQFEGPETVEMGELTLRKGTGETGIHVSPGTTLELRATLGDGTVDFRRTIAATGEFASEGRIAPTLRTDAGLVYRWTFENPNEDGEATLIAPVTIEQASGSVLVLLMEED